MDNLGTITIRMLSSASGIQLLVYIQADTDLVVEHVDVSPSADVILAAANRLDGGL
jgi:hypothetical protein